jgi:hypothetical protein
MSYRRRGCEEKENSGLIMEGRLTPIKAIRAKCIECAGSKKEVSTCPEIECVLFAYRFGKNPARKGIGGLKTLPFWLQNPKLRMENQS